MLSALYTRASPHSPRTAHRLRGRPHGELASASRSWAGSPQVARRRQDASAPSSYDGLGRLVGEPSELLFDVGDSHTKPQTGVRAQLGGRFHQPGRGHTS
jgi:hypothetical protein